jgi:cysteine synthase
MVRRSTWWATAIGTAVGTGGWLLGVGRIASPAHPGWALFGITIAATIITQIAVEWETRHNIARAQAGQAPARKS